QMEVPLPDDEKQQLLELEVTQVLPPDEEQELHDEDGDTQKVATPKALKKYLQNQKTSDLAALNTNGASRGLQKQEQTRLRVTSPNGSRRPLANHLTLEVGAPNGAKSDLPEQETLKVSVLFGVTDE